MVVVVVVIFEIYSDAAGYFDSDVGEARARASMHADDFLDTGRFG